MSYKPLLEFLTIKKSKLDGLGLFTKSKINKDFALGYSHYHIVSSHFNDLIRTPLSGHCNHSKTPNCTIIEYDRILTTGYKHISYIMVTTRDIKANEELVLDYTKELCGLNGYKDEEWLKK